MFFETPGPLRVKNFVKICWQDRKRFFTFPAGFLQDSYKIFYKTLVRSNRRSCSVKNTCKFIKKRLQHKCFPIKFAKFFKNTYFEEHLRMTAWDLSYKILTKSGTSKDMSYVISKNFARPWEKFELGIFKNFKHLKYRNLFLIERWSCKIVISSWQKPCMLWISIRRLNLATITQISRDQSVISLQRFFNFLPSRQLHVQS